MCSLSVGEQSVLQWEIVWSPYKVWEPETSLQSACQTPRAEMERAVLGTKTLGVSTPRSCV